MSQREEAKPDPGSWKGPANTHVHNNRHEERVGKTDVTSEDVRYAVSLSPQREIFFPDCFSDANRVLLSLACLGRTRLKLTR